MNHVLLFFDAAPTGGTIGAIFGVAFFLLIAGAAFIAWKSLRKTVKWAVRIAIVVALLVIALVGSITLWWYSSSKPARAPRPGPTAPR
jgi:Kef-type K+ transport system membrane component KefB